MSIELQEAATTEASWQLAGAELGTAQSQLVFKVVLDILRFLYNILQHCTLYIIFKFEHQFTTLYVTV